MTRDGVGMRTRVSVFNEGTAEIVDLARPAGNDATWAATQLSVGVLSIVSTTSVSSMARRGSNLSPSFSTALNDDTTCGSLIGVIGLTTLAITKLGGGSSIRSRYRPVSLVLSTTGRSTVKESIVASCDIEIRAASISSVPRPVRIRSYLDRPVIII